MRCARRIGGRVARARLAEAAESELACVASPARLAVPGWIVTADGGRVINAKFQSKLDDLAFGHPDQRSTDSNRRLAMSLDTGTRGKIRHSLECLDELGTTVGISAVVERVHADEYFARADDFGKGKRVGEENRVSSRHVSAGNLGVVVFELAIFRDRNIGRQ